MTQDHGAKPPRPHVTPRREEEHAQRRERLAEAMRRNLKKRKRRQRGEGDSEEGKGEDASRAPDRSSPPARPG